MRNRAQNRAHFSGETHTYSQSAGQTGLCSARGV